MAKDIAASIYAGNLLNIENSLDYLEKINIKNIHYDVMDGNFVSTVSIGELLLKSLTNYDFNIDLHLMHNNPLNFLENISPILNKLKFITIHFECDGFKIAYDYLKKSNISFGIAINPSTNVEQISEYINEVDVILCMSVVPGKSGQSFIDITSKIKKIRHLGFKSIIQVDGGINDITLELCKKSGANHFVMGSYLFNKDNFEKMKNLV